MTVVWNACDGDNATFHIRSALQITVLWDLTPCILVDVRRHIPEQCDLQF
jgi:hypothetical protein